MTLNAMQELWEAFDRLRAVEIEFWFTAAKLQDAGLVNIEDVANVYGVHTDTARKRLRNWRESFDAGSRDPFEPPSSA